METKSFCVECQTTTICTPNKTFYKHEKKCSIISTDTKCKGCRTIYNNIEGIIFIFHEQKCPYVCDFDKY